MHIKCILYYINVNEGDKLAAKIKNRLLDIRLELKFKFAKDFAEFLNIAQTQYSRYESNEVQPTAESLYKICTKTNKRIEEVLYYPESD